MSGRSERIDIGHLKCLYNPFGNFAPPNHITFKDCPTFCNPVWREVAKNAKVGLNIELFRQKGCHSFAHAVDDVCTHCVSDINVDFQENTPSRVVKNTRTNVLCTGIKLS
jgi:hypothetical protein